MKPSLRKRIDAVLDVLLCDDQLRLATARMALNEPMEEHMVQRIVTAQAAMTTHDDNGARLRIAREVLVKGKLTMETPIMLTIKLPAGYKGYLCPQDLVENRDQAFMGVSRAFDEQIREEVKSHA